eukprot:SAG31_NODE_362_length_16904_cov_7.893218_15_plen_82_part_00
MSDTLSRDVGFVNLQGLQVEELPRADGEQFAHMGIGAIDEKALKEILVPFEVQQMRTCSVVHSHLSVAVRKEGSQWRAQQL